AEITVMAAHEMKRFGIRPKVALLSHSNFGTSNEPSAVKMRDTLALLQKNAHDRPFCLALSLILGGAIGNVLDRLLYGAVVDFIDVHYDGWHWPAFNVADSAISIGATLIVINEIRRAIKDRP
ncbi:MAG: hypothetical protein EBY97_08250, partial [Burkholderiaceae bacterium]|nr:hypothetical protein [Burkholderiaceae bacterium]